MRISKHINDLLLIFFIFGTLSGSYLISKRSEKPTIFINKQQSSFNVDMKFWNYFHLGQKRLISSLLWVATILESDHDHYKGKDLNSWMYLRFNTISMLEPEFAETYEFGGPYLSIVKDDLDGASKLYLKGLSIYPNNFSLLRNASFHFYFEVQDYKTAYDILKKLQKHPKVTAIMLASLARINSQNGNLETAFSILNEAYSSLKVKDGLLAEKIHQNLYSIKAEIDLQCLNEKKENCSLLDLDNKPYLKMKDEKYVAQKTWFAFRIKPKKEE